MNTPFENALSLNLGKKSIGHCSWFVCPDETSALPALQMCTQVYEFNLWKDAGNVPIFPIGLILGVEVSDEWSCRGYGTILIKAAIEIMRKDGAKMAFVTLGYLNEHSGGTVENRPRIERFYSRAGFKIFENQKCAYMSAIL